MSNQEPKKKLTKGQFKELVSKLAVQQGKTELEVARELGYLLEQQNANFESQISTIEEPIKPDWITDEQWYAVPSVDWWEDSKKQAQSIAQSKPSTPQEALAQTTRLRNSKNWNQE